MKNTQTWGKTMDDVDEIMAQASRRRASNNRLVLILQGLTDSLDKASTLLDSELAKRAEEDIKNTTCTIAAIGGINNFYKQIMLTKAAICTEMAEKGTLS